MKTSFTVDSWSDLYVVVMSAVAPSETNDAAIAHVLRCCTFGPVEGQLAELSDREVEEVVVELIAHATDPSSASLRFSDPLYDVDETLFDLDESRGLMAWWLDQMGTSSNLHEKMVWYWHGHFTTSRDKAAPIHQLEQQRRLRRLALGNFRELCREMVTDGAILRYLDAADSVGSDPNENLARELLELFTLGRGNYAESDVRGGARILAGWRVDWETGEVSLDDDRTYPGAVEFLGHRGRFTVDDMVDIICDQPACARHVAGRIHRFFVGRDAEPDRLDELAQVFASNRLEILPLLEAIFTAPSFLDPTMARTKQPIEWYIEVVRALGWVNDPDQLWDLEILGQVPYMPPSPAGWPDGDRWLAGSHLLTRVNIIHERDWETEFDFDSSDPVPDVLAHLGLTNVSPQTRQALDDAYWAALDEQDVNRLLLVLAITSPEFQLA